MTRAWFLGFLIFVVLVAGLTTLRGAEFALAVPVLVLLVYSVWQTRHEMRLEAVRLLSAERAAPRSPVKVTLKVKNIGGAVEDLSLEDYLPPGLEVIDGSNRHLTSLRRGQEFQCTYSVRGPRGGYFFGALRMEGGDTLGLLHTRAVVELPGRLLVAPTVSRIKPLAIRPRRTKVYAGNIPAGVGGPGVEFFGVRPYEVGDSARHINWRAAARHPDVVFSNDFQQERVADVAVILDARQRTDLRQPAQSLFEFSVEATGSLASAFLQQGNRVGLLVYSHFLQWTLPGYGKMQRERILQTLAMAVPGASQVFEGLQYLPTRLFPSESQIVLVSPLLEEDIRTLIQLRARGYQVLVVCPDPVGFELRGLARLKSSFNASEAQLAGRVVRLERLAMLGRARRAGIQVIEWDTAQAFDQAMNSALRRVDRHMP